MLYRQSNFCTYSIKRSLFKNNSVDPAILEHSTEHSTAHCGIFWVVSVFWVAPVARKWFPLKYLRSLAIVSVFRTEIFLIQAIAVVPVFSVFFDRLQSSQWCFHIIVPVAWT